MNGKIFVYLAGYGPQFWNSLREPNIEGQAKGVTVYEFNDETGQLTWSSEITGIQSPGTIVVSPDQRFLYAANETRDFEGYPRGYGGGVTAFSINQQTGELTKINDSLSYGGFACYVNIDKTGKYLFVSNHGSYLYSTKFEKTADGWKPVVYAEHGSVAMFKVREDGGVGRLLDIHTLECPYDYDTAHPHSVGIDENDLVVAPNKGGDSVYLFRLNRETEKLDMLSNNGAPVGSNPRHVAFLKGTPYILIINENNAYITSYRFNEKDGTAEQVITLPTEQPGLPYLLLSKNFIHKNARATDIHISPNGRFVYANNNQGLIVQFEVDRESGMLTQLGYYKVGGCRGFQLDRLGRWLITNSHLTNQARVFSIHTETGALSQVCEIDAPSPTAARFVYL